MQAQSKEAPISRQIPQASPSRGAHLCMQAQLAASRAPKSPRPGRLEYKAAQLRAELEVHKDALAAAQMEAALLAERLSQAQAPLPGAALGRAPVPAGARIGSSCQAVALRTCAWLPAALNDRFSGTMPAGGCSTAPDCVSLRHGMRLALLASTSCV